MSQRFYTRLRQIFGERRIESCGAATTASRRIQDIGMFEWTRLDELIERGYEEALKVLTPLRQRLPRM